MEGNFQVKLSEHGQLNLELRMEEFDCTVTNNENSVTT